MSKLTSLLCALIFCISAAAQVSVAPSPVPKMQFFDNNGNPLSGGRIFTYLAGTTTQENTYTDASGSSQNPDPIILDAGGFPANGTVRTGIWLANKSYKFVVQDSHGVTQWTADNITGYLGLLNLSNTWTFSQIFTQPIIVTPSDNQIQLGAFGSQTILDAPPAGGSGVTLHFQTAIEDTVVNQNSHDDLKNKTLETPVLNSPMENTPIVNGTQVTSSPGTYIQVPNDTVNGTVLNRLAKFTTSNPVAAIQTSSGSFDTSGAIGVVVLNAGKTGIATIQQSGLATCQFDGNTTAGDYVQISTSLVGECRDAGPTYPTSGQVIGRATTTTGGGSDYYPLMLFGPEVNRTPTLVFCSNGVSSTTIVTNTSATALRSCQIPAGLFNVVGKTFRLTAQVEALGATTTTTSLYFGYGTSSALSVSNLAASSGSAASPNAHYRLQVTCTVATTGATGTASCTDLTSFSSNSLTITPSASLIAFNATDFTSSLFIGVMCSFGTSNALNSCTANQFSIEQLN